MFVKNNYIKKSMKKWPYPTMLLLLSLILLMGCNKSRKHSTWTVNGTETFSTKNVTAGINCDPDQNECRSVLQSNDGNNSFLIAFPFDYLPSSGYYLLNYWGVSTGITDYCLVSFVYNNQQYFHAQRALDTLYADGDAQPRYTLPPTWFLNENTPAEDSILVEGVFNEP